MSKYVFITNSTKPTNEIYESIENITLDNVSKPCIENALDLGYEVILGINRKYPKKIKCEDYPISFYNSYTFRNIFNIKDNWIAFRNLKNVLKHNDVKVIHCNTPIGGVIGRLCGHFYGIPKIIYTVHGFHFYKGAPLINRTIFKWIERSLAKWTDVIITINQEDYDIAKSFRLKNNGKVYKIPGVGIDISLYQKVKVNKVELRKSINIKESDFVCIGIGRVEDNKNYKLCIEAISQCENDNIHFIICGDGPQRDTLEQLAKDLHIENQIHFLGYTKQIPQLLSISDCYLSTSKREGLPRALMEAMASGLPCIVSEIRGNIDLIQDGVNGFLVPLDSVKIISQRIQKLVNEKNLRIKMSSYNLETIKDFDISVVKREIKKIYANNL